MQDTTAFADQKFTNAVNNFKIALGSQLSPALAKLKTCGANAFEWATDFVKNNPWLVSSISALVSSLAVLSAVLAGYTVYTTIVPKVTAAIKALNVALEANPAGLVAVGIATLAAALTAFISVQASASGAVNSHIKALKDSKQAYEDTAASYKEENTDTLAMAESLASLSEKEVKSASDKALILRYVDELNEKIPELNLAYDEQTDSLSKNSTAIIAAAKAYAKQKEQAAQVERLGELYIEQKENSDLLTQSQADLAEATEKYNDVSSKFFVLNPFAVSQAKDDMDQAQWSVDRLTKSGEDLQSQVDVLESTVNTASGNSTASVTESAENMTVALDGLIAKYDEAYASAAQALDATIGRWSTMDNTAVTSAANANAALQSQIDWLTQYDANLRSLEGRQIPGVDMTPLIQSLSDGSTQSAAILAGLKNASDEDVRKIAENMARVDTLKQSVSGTMAGAKTNFNQNLDEMNSKLTEAVKGMDDSSEAGQAARKTLQAYVDGIKSKQGSAVSAAQQIASAVQAALNNTHISVPGSGTTGGKFARNIKMFANGTDFSPDMFIAGENGPELVMGRNGSKIWTAQQTAVLLAQSQRMAAGGMFGGVQTVNHTGVIRVEGVNSQGDLSAVTEIIVDQLRRDARMN